MGQVLMCSTSPSCQVLSICSHSWRAQALGSPAAQAELSKAANRGSHEDEDQTWGVLLPQGLGDPALPGGWILAPAGQGPASQPSIRVSATTGFRSQECAPLQHPSTSREADSPIPTLAATAGEHVLSRHLHVDVSIGVDADPV